MDDQLSCHRIGGGNSGNLTLRPIEEKLEPAGISVLIGGTPEQAAADVRRVFGSRSSLGKKAVTVGTITIRQIRESGFDIVEDPSINFPNHGRLIHPTEGIAGFADENLNRLAQSFTNYQGL